MPTTTKGEHPADLLHRLERLDRRVRGIFADPDNENAFVRALARQLDEDKIRLLVAECVAERLRLEGLSQVPEITDVSGQGVQHG